ncbi:MAG TPA: hypothetical protein VE912_22100 [Bacteroidales bacterium]|nr:hypothetical protein [Bacteroidales bacterium]
MARVFKAIWNLKEAISKLGVLTNRNLIQGGLGKGNRAMDWERPNINRNPVQ